MPKIVRFHELGGPDVLRIEEINAPIPGPGEVRIKVKAIGLNFADIMFRQGTYIEHAELPSRLGYEASGVVDALWPRRVRIQDRRRGRHHTQNGLGT